MSRFWSFKLFEIEKRTEKELSSEREDVVNQNKDLAFYSESLAAWYQTKLERDKSILTISAGAIGLLITLTCSFLRESFGWTAFILFVVSIFFFAVTIVCSIIIFNKNADYIEHVLKDEAPNSLAVYDYVSWVAFIIGILMSITYAIVVLLTTSLQGGLCG